MNTNLYSTTVERWGLFELLLTGPSEGNPYQDVTLTAQFRHQQRVIRVDGFYDGNGTYKIRFMPDTEGRWTFEVSSSTPELQGAVGEFECTPAMAGNHGPVRVHDELHFTYEDGTVYHPFGTTCYAWTHQDQALQEETLATLQTSPFNKIRMCLFPKRYSFNSNEPDYFPFAGSKADGFDLTRFNPEYFANLEKRIVQLQELGIEADLILFHPYDTGHWGFDRMPAETDDFYLRYVIARLSAYRNVWWALANEFDFMKEKVLSDWDRFFRIVVERDPYQHLRSLHNGSSMYNPGGITYYDHTKPWVTHVSMQHWDVTLMKSWRTMYKKPIVVDECCYEGNLPQRWGNISGEEMTAKFWDCFARGGYGGHGETYMHPENIIWWARGGRLYGNCPERLAFMRKVLDDAPAHLQPQDSFRDVPTLGVEGKYYLQYYNNHRPAYRELPLPEEGCYRIEIIDTWNMTITALDGEFSGVTGIPMPGKPYMAVRVRAI
ncbi:DUF5605 domain-containing protein [Paenibacillus sp. y28]|uniref:DUF5605 domain-containing protein n=1 Tax=Paenibacillus sp. y28 TaxID=3129110 RepID=UPI00301B1E5E